MSLAPNLVLDAWPILEWLHEREPAAREVEELLRQARANQVTFNMSRINYGELIYGIRKQPSWPAERKVTSLDVVYALPLRLVGATDGRVDDAIELKSRYNISYADAFAASLAIECGLPLVTGDSEFRTLESDGLLRLHWVGA